jgi:hypothetical protein
MTVKHEVTQLLKMAEKFDEEGKLEEAASLVATANRLIEAAKEDEDDKEVAGLSNKQKAALRAFKNAAERVTKVFGNRIPRSCKELDNLAESVLKACESCDLDYFINSYD